MKEIQCSVWGVIRVSELALSIIDTFIFQRLHYIKQTGLAYKVFPSATTTRFAHSLGVYHTTRMMLNHLLNTETCSLPERTQELICIIGLVHDLGHGPFSHLFDEIASTLLIPSTHEERSVWLFRFMVEKYSIALSPSEVDFIVDRVHNPPNDNWYDTIVCNPYSSFDSDKFDYIFRDAMHLGVTIGVDGNRILHNMKIINNKICFCERIQQDIETFFKTRDKMHSSIYRHPTILKFQNRLLRLLKINLPAIANLNDFIMCTDMSLLQHLTQDEWFQLEERGIKSENIQTNYHDEQTKVAFANLRFYKRKDPSKSFKMNFS